MDEVQISVRSGDGGQGCVSYRRERFLPHGGPDGGDGGKGGDVLFQINPQLKSLLDLSGKRQYKSENGQPGGSQKKTGRNGKSLILQVPVGTLLKDENGKTLHDLCLQKQQIKLLEGGRGGKGNHFFKSSKNQAPSFAQAGQPGQEMLIHLELKLLADIGLVGFPNAGKSTLLSRLSLSRPKIADYPFTTLRPHLGILESPGQQPLIIADIPGLIVGAHKGIGLGEKFLRHIERSKGLLYVLDAHVEKPLEDYHALKKELCHYHKNKPLDFCSTPLYDRPHLVILNKIDVLTGKQLDSKLKQFKDHGISVIPLSAKDGLGFQTLLSQIKMLAVQVATPTQNVKV